MLEYTVGKLRELLGLPEFPAAEKGEDEFDGQPQDEDGGQEILSQVQSIMESMLDDWRPDLASPVEKEGAPRFQPRALRKVADTFDRCVLEAIRRRLHLILPLLLDFPPFDINDPESLLNVARKFRSWDCASVILDDARIDLRSEAFADTFYNDHPSLTEASQVLQKYVCHRSHDAGSVHYMLCHCDDERVYRIMLADPRIASLALSPDCEMSLLHAAAKNGLFDLTRELLADPRITNINQLCSDQWHPFHYAMAYGHLELARLLQNDPRFDCPRTNPPNEQSKTPLHFACEQKASQTAGPLFEFLKTSGTGAIENLDACSREGQNVLHCSVSGGNLEVVRRLLAEGMDPNIATARTKVPPYSWLNLTPVQLACFLGRLEILQLMIASPPGVNLWVLDERQRSLLFLAAQEGKLRMVQFLLEEHAVPLVYHEELLHPGYDEPMLITDKPGQIEITELLAAHGWWPFPIDPFFYSLTISEPLESAGTRDQIWALRNRLESEQREATIVACEQKWRPNRASDVYALLLFIGWGLLQGVAGDLAATHEEQNQAARFFSITSRLPLELQMQVCHKVYGSSGNFVTERHRIAAVRRLVRSFTRN